MSSLSPVSGQEVDINQVVSQAIEYAKANGADAVEVSANNDKGFSVSARLGEVETIEHHNQRSISITVYRGQAKGSASTNDAKKESVLRAVDAALNIAGHTAVDEYAGLADAALMASNYPELQLDHAWDISVEEALDLALQCENTARDDKRIVNSEGATVSSIRGEVAYANSHGFQGSYHSSRHSVSCSVVAEDKQGMQRDYWYSVACNANDLDDVLLIGERARERAIRRLSAHSIDTCEVPVLFEPSVARSLFGHFFSAISGGALYRQASFLVDTLGQQIFPEWLSISEDPHIPGALGSSPFDNEGVRTQARNIVTSGVLEGYVLSSYSGRRLGMPTTGNAGGIHNIQLSGSDISQEDLIKSISQGLLVTELIGHGVNTVTGDYSRGASGFWVENGQIKQPVEEVTIAGNLKDMFKNIKAVGNDIDTCGSIQCGSVLIDELTVAGSS